MMAVNLETEMGAFRTVLKTEGKEMFLLNVEDIRHCLLAVSGLMVQRKDLGKASVAAIQRLVSQVCLKTFN